MIEFCEMFWRKQALSGSANAHFLYTICSNWSIANTEYRKNAKPASPAKPSRSGADRLGELLSGLDLPAAQIAF
jgi:hypothetical protein